MANKGNMNLISIYKKIFKHMAISFTRFLSQSKCKASDEQALI